MDPIEKEAALVPAGQDGQEQDDLALLSAVEVWARSTSNSSSPRCDDIHRDKKNAVLSFLSFFAGFAGLAGVDKGIAKITQKDVKAWIDEMKSRKLAETTVHTRVCYLSSFFKWILENRLLGLHLRSNPLEKDRYPIGGETALAQAGQAGQGGQGGQDQDDLALLKAIEVWARSTSRSSSPRYGDIHRDKKNAVLSFFAGAGKGLAEIATKDVKAWIDEMKSRKLAETTIYTRISHLSSFFKWVRKDWLLGLHLRSNPVEYAFPKAPRPYQTREPKSLSTEQVESLLKTVKAKAGTGDLTSLRDYALLLLFLTTGMRRSEILALKGNDIRLEKGKILIRARIKGGDYCDREVDNPTAFAALQNYLRCGRRLTLLRTNKPLWIRHDRDDDPPRPLSGWSFVQHLKEYAKEAGIGDVHLHQLRHTFAGVVASHSGSMSEAQEALNHRHLSTTCHYLRSIQVKKDEFSRYVIEAFELPDDEEGDEGQGSDIHEAWDESKSG